MRCDACDNGRTWNFHKNILCSRGVWFEKALTGNFEESRSGVVEIRSFDPEAVDWVIRYIYTGSMHVSSPVHSPYPD